LGLVFLQLGDIYSISGNVHTILGDVVGIFKDVFPNPQICHREKKYRRRYRGRGKRDI
jgi:hypothetical protein